MKPNETLCLENDCSLMVVLIRFSFNKYIKTTYFSYFHLLELTRA
jgi:hypothetical protein